ncbi:molybdopterin-dependent oxidoreductase [Deinococcus arcticus]|uniref:Molybdopterin-binding oxidoreductase n=1 Tax=Deinococcus arcticus TaxID=2136176 RepID=A0A2T3W892_9DEIO|nr:molybdopterin-dependent oxidoreductase [Deinococcus arcticus]PTA68118.1 molybdopterin-binding oxidoreductase [Deinococcus arcticus]
MNPLPSGQRWLSGPMPRFGLAQYVQRWADPSTVRALGLHGEVHFPLAVAHGQLASLPRVALTAHFHCVTTWSVPDLCWEGWRVQDLWAAFFREAARPSASHVRISGADGYATCLPLEEFLHPSALLADRLAGQPLSQAHGAPLRLVVPRLYGYKNVKHVQTLELLAGPAPVSGMGRLLAHPRGRADLEERSGVGFQPFWRRLYASQLSTFLRQAERFQSPPDPLQGEPHA